MYEPDDILEAARSIRPFLNELVGDSESSMLDQQLADLLTQAGTQQPIENNLLELLATHEATREWTQAFLQEQEKPVQLRDYKQLPGQPSIVNATKFVCPYGDYIWYRPRVGIQPPNCPTHNCPLEPE